ncbi:MAG: hypothetical protein V3V36_01675 [Candidatus Hydrothermarchaeaceae archaeon]
MLFSRYTLPSDEAAATYSPSDDIPTPYTLPPVVYFHDRLTGGGGVGAGGAVGVGGRVVVGEGVVVGGAVVVGAGVVSGGGVVCWGLTGSVHDSNSGSIFSQDGA